MKTKTTLLVGLFVTSFALNAQLKVTTDGQVQLDSQEGKPEQSTQISIDNYSYFSTGRSILNLLNKTEEEYAPIPLAFSTMINNKITPVAYISAACENRDRGQRSSSLSMGTYIKGDYKESLSIYSYGGDNTCVRIGQGRSGLTSKYPKDVSMSLLDWSSMSAYEYGVLFDTSGYGEATIRPKGSGFGYIGTSNVYWSHLYVNNPNFRNHPAITSDEREKENIQAISNENVIDKLFELRPVSYKLKKAKGEEQKISLYNNGDRSAKAENEKQYGFIAQELQEVFPELVLYNKESDTYSIKYTALIPILVEGLQDLKRENAELRRLKENGSNAGFRSATASKEVEAKGKNPILFDNTPNPFDGKTRIDYFVPADVQEAYVAILDLQGKLLEVLSCEERGQKSSLFFDGKNLFDGLYLYSLVVNGKEIDTKKMILKR